MNVLSSYLIIFWSFACKRNWLPSTTMECEWRKEVKAKQN
jgi:hypothetical protein